MARKLALLGGKPVGAIRQPRHPSFPRAAVDRVVGLLESGSTVGLGRRNPEIAKAERAISKYHDGRQALTVTSGHAALMSALMGLEIGPGDEVITTPYSWGASTSCILAVGAVPVFADVDPVTGLIDPASVAERVTRRTRAILPVHIFGQPANMPVLQWIARKHDLFLIEDGSQAHGARVQGEVVGNFSHAAGFSCMGGKLLATAEAGYMVTPNPDVYWRAAMMCQHYGRSADPGFPEKYKPYVDSLVYSFRLTPMIACLLPYQIRRLDREVANRRANVELFRRELRGASLVELPALPRGFESSHHIVTLNFHAGVAGISKATYMAALRAEGVGVFQYVPSPIPTWKRLQWRGFRGPPPMWLAQLRRARVNYEGDELPGCHQKIERSLEFSWNFTRIDKRAMKRLASAFLKVEENIDSLRDWERGQKKAKTADPTPAVTAARQAVRRYSRG